MSHGRRYTIREQDERYIFPGDSALLRHIFHVLPQFAVIFRSEQDDRELVERLGLHKGQRFEKFIHRTKPAGHDDEGIGVFYHKGLADKEMFEGERGLHIRIRLLLERQLDIAAHRTTSLLEGATVSRLHNARPSSRHRRKAHGRDLPAEFTGGLIMGMVFLEAGRPEYGDTGSHEMQGAEAPDEFTENIPGKA